MGDSQNEWGSNLSFLLAMVGAAVGLGNIWRFPYVLYSSGGGAFYIPYLVAVLILGVPFIILEYAVGYNFKASFAKGLRKIHKKFEFLGWLIPISNFTIMIYYSAIIGWIGVYVVVSFYKGWGDNPKYFYENTLVKSTSSPSGLLQFIPAVGISMIIDWVIIWFVSHRELEKGLGKVSKILVPLLFIVMTIIVVYSLTLDDATLGLYELFHPKWESLLNFKIWMSAFGQIIFSLNLGLSLGFTYAGYSGKETDLITNALIIALSNCLFENFCALGVFSVLGYMAKIENVAVNEVIKQGTSLIYITYPAVINTLGKFGYVLGPAFFITVFLAGLTSFLAMIEPISFCIQNKFTWDRKKCATVLLIIGGALSLLFATAYGDTLLGIVDTYINQILILLCILVECIAFAWVFKAENTMRTLNDRSKSIKLGTWWLLIVKYILPIFIIFVWIGGVIDTVKTGTTAQTISFVILTVLIFGITSIFTFKKPTNKTWDEAENRL